MCSTTGRSGQATRTHGGSLRAPASAPPLTDLLKEGEAGGPARVGAEWKRLQRTQSQSAVRRAASGHSHHAPAADAVHACMPAPGSAQAGTMHQHVACTAGHSSQQEATPAPVSGSARAPPRAGCAAVRSQVRSQSVLSAALCTAFWLSWARSGQRQTKFGYKLSADHHQSMYTKTSPGTRRPVYRPGCSA